MRSPTEAEMLAEVEILRDQIRELQGRQAKLLALLECQQALGESLDLAQLQETIVRQASAISGAAGVRLFLLEDSQPAFRCRDGDALTPDEMRTLEFLLAEGKPDPRAASEFQTAAEEDASRRQSVPMVRLGDVTCLCLPLAMGERIFGILAIPTPASRKYTAEEIDAFGMLARQASLAFRNARHSAATQQELIDYRQKAASVQSSLAEKETLLREVHHRAKNNFQVVASLLDLRARTLRNAAVRQTIREIRDRVQSMAWIHEHLFKSPDAGRVAMDAYLRQLVTALRQACNAERIVLSLQVTVAPLGIDQAIPCGLIVNELVSNVFKHAFPGGQTGEVLVALENRDGRNLLTVRDTGVGLPPQLDPESAGSLGLRLVGLLAKQLGGTLHLASEPGATVRISFPARPLDEEAP